MKAKVVFFAVATLTPVPLLVLGAVQNGPWIWAALLYLSLFTFLLDELGRFSMDPSQPTQEFPAANALSVMLALLHFVLLGLAVWSLANETHFLNGVAKYVAFGLFFGQVSNSNAHELIHRPKRALFLLGKWVFISHLFGHHTSAHRLIHHRYAATKQDPNTARFGESFYHFARRAWIGSYQKGWRAETKRRASRSRPGLHPYVTYFAGAVLFLFTAFALAGLRGLIAYILLAGFATLQILMSDYVQHYGLVRAQNDDHRPEPVCAHHSWNAPHWFSGFLMLNATRHSDHHIHPNKPYPMLEITPNLPTLPYSLATMGFVALFPRRWRKVMHPRVAMNALAHDKTRDGVR